MTKDQPVPSLPVRIYSPERSIRHPMTMVKEIIRDIIAGRELAWRLFTRDLSAQYRKSYLGYIWAIVPPFAASLTFVFLNSQGIVRIDTGGVPYPAFAMMGTLLWQVFVDGTSCAPSALTGSGAMLTKINFPREALLIAKIYMAGFNLLIRLVALAAVMALWGIAPSASLLFFPIAMAALFGLGLAIGLIIAPLSSLYGDVSRAMGVILPFWMLFTPVVYPARTSGLAGLLSEWNPVSPVLTTARESLSGMALSLLPAFGVVSALTLLGILVGVIGMRVAMPHLIARMGG